jgi:ubiquinone/menaquinone biosynthesis C-methylase UbiE
MTALALKPGERVADIGAGSGYFTVRLAKAVGPNGLVWAIDIEPALLDHIEKRLEEEKVRNVRVKLVPEDDPQLPAGSVDTILLVHTYTYLQDRSEYAKKLRTALAPGGRVVIIDYIPTSWEKRPWGPLPHQQVSRETVDAEMAPAGLKPIKTHDFLPMQYFVEYAVR